MNTKAISGVVAAIAVWWAGFFLFGAVLVTLIPGSREAAEIAISENDWSQFSTTLLLGLIGMYLIINPLAGWLTVFIAKQRIWVWATLTPLFLYAAHSHLIRLWDNLPNWYNVAVVVLIPPLVYLGGRLTKIESTNETE